MSQLITWNNRYSVGVARIDAQHQRLVEFINELHAAMLAGAGRQVVGKTLDGLVEYTLSHFAAEEALMKQAAYPGYEPHKAEHTKLVEQVTLLKKKAQAANAALTIEVAAFLNRWLVDHISNVDKKYSAHLLAAGIK